MTLGRRIIVFLLLILFVGAVWVRLDRLGSLVYPYYTGESGTNFRHAQMIANDGRLPALDLRASGPEGYAPSRAKPTGVEHFTGYAMRMVRPFTDLSDRKLAGVITLLVFSASIFTMYGLTHRLWGCRAAGVFAAFLVAFSAPLVDATSGKEYFHAPYAYFVVSLHLMLFAGFVSRPSAARAVATALAALVLFSLWISAGLYAALFVLAVLIMPKLAPEARRWTVASHLAAALLAALVLPHLRADRFVLAWPIAWLLVASAYTFLRDKVPRRLPVWLLIPGVFVVLAVILRAVRSQPGELLDPLAYWYYRLRFVAGPPDDPTKLPDLVRIAWAPDRQPPEARTIVEFFLPLVFLVVPAAGVFRRVAREKGSSPWFFVAVTGLGSAVFFLDGGAIFPAALVAFPFVSGAMKGFGTNAKTRAFPALVAVVLVAAFTLPGIGRTGFLRSIETPLGLSPGSPRGFLWASIGNADRELVRFLATRTSTRNDVILASPRVSSLIVTFAGRATVVAPGVYTRAMAAKTVELFSGFYADEQGLLDRCGRFGATHVVYSIDMLLDGSSYSPRYVSAAEEDMGQPIAFKMHFAPEALRHFQLVYENDNHRVFRVTTKTEPVFLTDHPPVYQAEILRTAGGDLGVFYSRIVDILATYHTATEAQTKGDEEGAIRRFEYCLGHAPSFTAARLGMGDSLLRLRRPERAYEAYRRVLDYAPDNSHALYYGALSLAYTERRSEALGLVELLLSATADRVIVSDALELKRALASGRRVAMPDPPSPQDPGEDDPD